MAFSRSEFFDFFSKANITITAVIHYNEQRQQIHSHMENQKKDSTIEEGYSTHESMEEFAQEEGQQTGDNKESASAPYESHETLSSVRLEVPSLHEGILRRGRFNETKHMDNYRTDTYGSESYVSDTHRMVLLKHQKERLQYDLYWIGVYVGWAQLTAQRSLLDVTITSEVHSARFISNFYHVEDYAKSVVANGKPSNFRIRQHEGKYRSDKETFFDYNEGIITFVDYLKNKQMEHKVKEEIHWDVISGFYYLRSMPVIDTERIYVNVFDSNKFIKVQVVILGREKIEMRNGNEFDTIKAKVIIHSEGLFQKIGDIVIWLKDDESRIPLRVETKVPVGKVTAELKGIDTD